MAEVQKPDLRTPKERFLEDFAFGLRVGSVSRLMDAAIRVSTDLTGIPSDLGKPGDAMYDQLFEQMGDMLSQYLDGDEARTVIYLADMGISRLQVLYRDSRVSAEPTSESSKGVREAWRR